MANIERKPILVDYLAGGVLTSSLVWVWLQLVHYIPNQIILFVYVPMLVVLSGISTYIVCMKTSKDHINIGIRTALSSWLISVLFFLTVSFYFDLNILLILLICYVVGGLGGAYIALKMLPESEERKPELDHQVEAKLLNWFLL